MLVASEELHSKTSTEGYVLLASPAKEGIQVKTVMTPTVPGQDYDSIPQQSGVFTNVGIAVGTAMSAFVVALLAQRIKRARRNKFEREMLDRACYQDETPIRVRVMGELEGVENNDIGYVDDDDLHSISECSLEEIELGDNADANNYREYLQNVNDGGYDSYFEDATDFTNIIGSLVSGEIQ